MKPLKWSTRIERAEVKGKFTRNAKAAADQWPSCAVGERLAAINIIGADAVGDFMWNSAGLAHNSSMKELGYQFTGAVNRDDIAAAKRIYAKIQKVTIRP